MRHLAFNLDFQLKIVNLAGGWLGLHAISAARSPSDEDTILDRIAPEVLDQNKERSNHTLSSYPISETVCFVGLFVAR